MDDMRWCCGGAAAAWWVAAVANGGVAVAAMAGAGWVGICCSLCWSTAWLHGEAAACGARDRAAATKPGSEATAAAGLDCSMTSGADCCSVTQATAVHMVGCCAPCIGVPHVGFMVDSSISLWSIKRPPTTTSTGNSGTDWGKNRDSLDTSTFMGSPDGLGGTPSLRCIVKDCLREATVGSRTALRSIESWTARITASVASVEEAGATPNPMLDMDMRTAEAGCCCATAGGLAAAAAAATAACW